MLELEEQVNQLINQIVLKAENQHELLIEMCIRDSIYGTSSTQFNFILSRT